MSSQDLETRRRVRAMVRDVLEKATDAEESSEIDESSAIDKSSEIETASPEAKTRNASSSNIDFAAAANNYAPSLSVDPVSTQSESVIPTRSEPRATQSVEPQIRDESAQTILTESDLHDLKPGAKLRVREAVKFTALAADIIRERGIELITRTSSTNKHLPARRIAIGSDHGGFEYKQQLVKLLSELGQHARDFGTHSTDAVDYPDIAHAVATSVAGGETDLGIIIDGAGIGSAMAANKVKGIRAAACYSVALARNSREHNGANVLTLGSKINSFDEVIEIVRAWLESELTEPRHKARVAKIEAVL